MLQRDRVRLAPIHGPDLDEVGEFLHLHLNARLSASAWAASIVPTWPVRSPNHGYVLRDDGRVVGVQLAFYSERAVGDAVVDLCNLGAWCVLEDYRAHGVRLLRAALSQRSYHFTDLSPSGAVVPINRKLGFETLDTSTALLPHSPVVRSRGVRVLTDLSAIERMLSGHDLRIFRDHRAAAAAIHLVLRRGDEHTYVVVRRERRKGLPVFASLLHVGDPELLRAALPALGRHLLLRHGIACSLIELRLVGARPHGSYLLASARPKMFRSPKGASLPASAVDNLYSELALVAW